MASIDCFVTAGANANAYGAMLRRNMLSLASGKHDFSWNCILIDDHPIPDGFVSVGRRVASTENPSLTHSKALNQVVDLSSADYVLFADADVAVLMDGWDDELVKRLIRPVVTIGTAYHKHSACYQNFPCAILMLVETEALRSVHLDFSPEVAVDGRIRRRVVSDTVEAETLEVKVDRQFKNETGWRGPAAFKSAGFAGYPLTCVRYCDPESLMTVPTPEERAPWSSGTLKWSEYHLDGRLIATHMLSSRAYAPETPYAQGWIHRIRESLRRAGKGVYA